MFDLENEIFDHLNIKRDDTVQSNLTFIYSIIILNLYFVIIIIYASL